MPDEESRIAERDAIVRAALDYFEGWFEGDAARMRRAVHPDLAKRSPDDAPAPGELEKLTAQEMIERTAEGSERRETYLIGGSKSKSTTSTARSRT